MELDWSNEIGSVSPFWKNDEWSKLNNNQPAVEYIKSSRTTTIIFHVLLVVTTIMKTTHLKTTFKLSITPLTEN